MVNYIECLKFYLLDFGLFMINVHKLQVKLPKFFINFRKMTVNYLKFPKISKLNFLVIYGKLPKISENFKIKF